MSEERPDEDLDALLADLDLDEAEDDRALEAEDHGGSEPDETEDDAEVRELDSRAAEQAAELERLRALEQQTAIARQQAMIAEEAERLAGMSYDERQQYFAAAAQRQIAIQEFRRRDQADSASFKKLLTEKRVPASYGAEAERVLAAARQHGMYQLTRADVLQHILGREVLEGRGGRVATTGRSRATPRQRGRQAREDEALLSRMTFRDFMNR